VNSDKREAIATRLAEIAAKNDGRLTPDDVLKDAKSVKSPLHDQFEWDDSDAARQWRLGQARTLIRSVKIEIETTSRIVSTVCYIRDPTADKEQGYVQVAKLRDDESLAREALNTEMIRVSSVCERARSLALALGLESELQDIQMRVEKLRGIISLAA